MRKRFVALLALLTLVMMVPALGASAGGLLGYEPAYYNGQTVTINAIEVHQNPRLLDHGAADLYEVMYPVDHSLWGSNVPQCDPCDHAGDGITPDDYHDHVLDSVPGSPAGNDYRVPWHVFLIQPAPGEDAAYAALLPLDSETKIDAAIAADVAVEIDTHFYFLCAVVDPAAAA